MAEIYGWSGVVLRVDMTKGTISKERLDPEVARKLLVAGVLIARFYLMK